MKKKIILASLFAAVLALALPMMAFAAESPTNTQTKTQAGVTATLVGSSESIDNLVIESASASNTVSGALGSQTLLGDYNVYFTDGKTSDFGTLTLSFPASGNTAQVWEVHNGTLTKGSDQTVSNGTVAATTTTLSEFAVVSGTGSSSASGSSSSSSTSPKTGAESTTLIALMTIASLAGAAGVGLVLRRKALQK